MKDHERPSILAVGLPEIFDTADRDAKSSVEETLSSSIASTSRVTGTQSRIGSDPAMLQWLIFSAKKQSLAPRRQLDAGECHLGQFHADESIAKCEDTACDDSAYGLSLGAGEPMHADSSDEVSFIYASNAKRAIELLRIMRFDLLVTSDQLPDMAVSRLVGRVRAVRPWQKWAMVISNDVQTGNAVQSEIAARSLGAAAIFDAPGDLGMISELAQAVAARQPAKMAVGMAVGGPTKDTAVSSTAMSLAQPSRKLRKTGGVAKSTRPNRAKA